MKRFENEESYVLVGYRRGRMWYGRLREYRAGAPARVVVDWQWVLDREERYGDVIGFYHTHPPGMTEPSTRDVRTMRAWASCFGKALLCVIQSGEFLDAFCFADDESEGGDDLERRATLALENLGFDTAQFDQQVGLLSGGERSRLSLAQVLVMDTDLLLLDEPTVHLDLRGTEFLEQHLANFGGAAVVVTHDRSFIDRFATRIAAIEADGSLSLHAELSDRQSEAEAEPLAEPIFSRVEESGKMVFVANKLSLIYKEFRRFVN